MLVILLGPAVLQGQSRQETWKQCTSNDPERSIAGCSALIQSGQETDTNLAKAFDGRGLAYARKHDFDHAILDYDQALSLDPRSGTAYYNRGVAYEFKGDYDRAFPDLDQAVRLTPRDADSVFCRGLALVHMGIYDRAIQDFDLTLSINPTYRAAFYNRALSSAHRGAYVSAMADYGRWYWLRLGILGIARLCLVLVALAFGVGEFRKGDHHDVQFIRRFMGWVFAAESVRYLEVTLRSISDTIHRHSIFPLLSAAAFSLVVACLSGLAWWTIWKRKSSAKGFAIAASLMQILIFVRQFIFPFRPAGDYHATALLVGTVGLLAFLRQDWPLTPLNQEEQSHFTSLFPDVTAGSKVAKPVD
jgi:hypothetical protein